MDAPGLVDFESFQHARRGHGLAMRGEADQLALVPVRCEAERAREARVHQPDAVGLLGPRDALVVAAEHEFDSLRAGDIGAVGDAVAGPVGGVDQRFVELAVEIGGEAVREMIIVEMQPRLREPFARQPFVGAEHLRRLRRALLAHHVVEQPQPPAPARRPPHLIERG